MFITREIRPVVADILFIDQLKRLELFDGVDVAGIVPLLNHCPVVSVVEGEAIVKVGEIDRHMHLILSGSFRVHLPHDLATPVALLESGQSIGEISIIDSQPASATIIATQDSILLTVDENVFWELVRHSHMIAYNMLILLAERLRYGNSIINKLKGLLDEYEYHAISDSLTNLYNRRWLDSTLLRVMERCRRNGEPLSVMMIDIDRFKQFNDKHGHIAGDIALRTVSQLILVNLRPVDFVTRYGGEELFALLPGLNLEAAMVVAERLRLSVSQTEIELNEDAVLAPLTISIGVAEMESGCSPEQLVHAADTAMYRAKKNGRDQVRD